MNKAVFDKILQKQEHFHNDPAYQQLLREHEILNSEFLKQLETMSDSQRNAVLDYCGLLIEIHLKMLEYSVQNRP